MARDGLVGIDIGTTTVKALLIDTDGRVLAARTEGYPTRRPRPGHVEQDPEDWLRLVLRALEAFAGEGVPVAGIGFTSQVNTHVFAGADLAPLRPALVWQDTRAEAAARRIDEGIAAAERLGWFGAPMPVDASNAVARMADAAETDPALWAATVHVMSPKDWVIARLTGAVMADPIASVGLVGPDLRYAQGFLDRVAGAAGRLPALSDPLEGAGRVQAGLPLAGVPVTLGTMDAWAGMFGAGVTRPGEAFWLSGTSEIMGVLSADHAPEPGVVVFAPWRGLTLHAAPTQSGGASLDWLARLFGASPGALCEEAALPGRGGPLFLPHLDGERAPFWDASARGVFAGLGGGSGRAELAGAVLEGVALSARLAFEAACRSGAAAPGAVRAGGGGMRSARWCQLRADVLGLPLERVAVAETGALGAALMAGPGAGVVADLPEAAARLVAVDRVFVPDPERHERAGERLRLYGALYDGVRPVNPSLV